MPTCLGAYSLEACSLGLRIWDVTAGSLARGVTASSFLILGARHGIWLRIRMREGKKYERLQSRAT